MYIRGFGDFREVGGVIFFRGDGKILFRFNLLCGDWVVWRVRFGEE